jgi:hypothetical protein
MPQKDKPQYEVSQWLQILKEPWKSIAVNVWRESPDFVATRGRVDSLDDALNVLAWDSIPVDSPFFEMVTDIFDTADKYVEPQYLYLLK